MHSHFRDIGQDESVLDVTYENGQARVRKMCIRDRLRGDGTPAQKAAQQHAIGFGRDIEKQLHPLSLPKNFTPYLNLL